jgi:hypothetical protein
MSGCSATSVSFTTRMHARTENDEKRPCVHNSTRNTTLASVLVALSLVSVLVLLQMLMLVLVMVQVLVKSDFRGQASACAACCT